MYITFTLHLHYICITFTLHLHCIYIAFTLHLHYINITFTLNLHLHCIYITFTLHVFVFTVFSFNPNGRHLRWGRTGIMARCNKPILWLGRTTPKLSADLRPFFVVVKVVKLNSEVFRKFCGWCEVGHVFYFRWRWIYGEILSGVRFMMGLGFRKHFLSITFVVDTNCFISLGHLPSICTRESI